MAKNAKVGMNFKEWEMYILENDLRLRAQRTEKGQSLTIEEKKVYSFSREESYNLGMSLKNLANEVRIYIDSNGYERTYYSSYTDENNQGLLHMHGNVEIGYVIDGQANQNYYDNYHQFHKGDFWIVDRNCYHSDVYELGSMFTVFIGIPADVMDEAFLDELENVSVRSFFQHATNPEKGSRELIHFSSGEVCPETEAMMTSLVEEVVGKKTGYKHLVKGMLLRVLEAVTDSHELKTYTYNQRKVSDQIYKEMDAYMHQHFDRVSLAELSEQFYYNHDYFNRLIKAYTGLTFTSYLQAIRLEEAAKLIAQTQKPIQEVINEVGYSSKGHFYKLFKDKYGKLPVDYRKDNGRPMDC